MIINNFKQIIKLLDFPDEDSFYHLQVLLRKKDLPEHARGNNNNSRCIKTYYVKNKEYLLSKEQEIIKLCELFTARAYINLNRKSLKKAAILTVSEITNRIIQNQESHIYRAYESVVGDKGVNIGPKYWIIDIDTKDESIIEKTMQTIKQCQSNQTQMDGTYPNIIALIETVNGWHIITHAFNLKQMEPFKCLYPFDVQKNNPTLLYFNKIE